MQAYSRMRQLGITDVKAFNDLGLTAQPIRLEYLLELLNFRGMLRKTDGSGGDERWKGTLQNIKQALVAASQDLLVSEYEMWFSHITNPRQLKWDTTIPEFAAGFRLMRDTFAGLQGMPTLEDFATVAALGGGWLTITQEEYDQAEKQKADQALEALIEQRITNAVALARERITVADSDEQRAAKWNQAWIDSEV